MGLPGDRGAEAKDQREFTEAQHIFQRLRVCGGTTLYALHDRILQPALGW